MAKAKQQAAAQFLHVDLSVDNEELASMVIGSKEFKSGKGGWWGQTRMAAFGKQYQVQVQVVEITSKREG